jgi:hypothetical protein
MMILLLLQKFSNMINQTNSHLIVKGLEDEMLI